MGTGTDESPLYTPRNIAKTAIGDAKLAERYHVDKTSVNRETLVALLNALVDAADNNPKSRWAGWTRCKQLTLARKLGIYRGPAGDDDEIRCHDDGTELTPDEYREDDRKRKNAVRTIRRRVDILIRLGLVMAERSKIVHYRVNVEACEAIRESDELCERDGLPRVIRRLQDGEAVDNRAEIDEQPGRDGPTTGPKSHDNRAEIDEQPGRDGPTTGPTGPVSLYSSSSFPSPPPSEAVTDFWSELGEALATRGVRSWRRCVDGLRGRGIDRDVIAAAIQAFDVRTHLDAGALVERLRNIRNGEPQDVDTLWPAPANDDRAKQSAAEAVEETSRRLAADADRRRDEAKRWDDIERDFGEAVDAMAAEEVLSRLEALNPFLARHQRQAGPVLTRSARRTLLASLANETTEVRQ